MTTMPTLDILFADNHHLVVNKPAGLLVQGDRSGRGTLLDLAKAWLAEEYDKPGGVFLGLVHRLDRTTSGAVVLARTSKAAGRLSEQFRRGTPEKTYLAIVEGVVPPEGVWEDALVPDGHGTKVGPGGKPARLSFVRLEAGEGQSLVKVRLETGRKHQIRAQFAHRGHPLLGDRRYGAARPFRKDAVALHAWRLRFDHIVSGERIRCEAPPPFGPGS